MPATSPSKQATGLTPVMLLIAASTLWSTSGIILKSLPQVHWLAIAGVRSAFGALIFAPGLFQTRPPARRLLPAVLLYAVVVSSLMGSMQLGTAAQGIWLQYLAPAVVALWAAAVQRQRLRRAEVAAVGLTLVAVVLIVAGGSGPGHAGSVLLGIVSGFAFGFLILVLKGLADTPPAAIFFWTNLTTACLLIPLAMAASSPLPSAPREIGLLALMGIGQLSLPYFLFQRGLAGTRPVEAALIALIEPILNPIWVYLGVREVPSPRVIAGCALIALGLVAFALARRRQAPPAAP